jgi:hypothetical protein
MRMLRSKLWDQSEQVVVSARKQFEILHPARLTVRSC